MGSTIPKQFIIIGDKPVLMHTITRFHEFDPLMHIIVVLPEAHLSAWSEMTESMSFNIPHTVIAGGSERYFSVRAGLSLINDNDAFVAVHDGVRPLVSFDTLKRCFDDAEKYGMAIPFIEPADSVRIEKGGTNMIVPRNEIRLIQTPQVFQASLILNAYQQQCDESFTDDASVAEAAGYKVHLTPGNRENIKITTPEDIAFARAFLAE